MDYTLVRSRRRTISLEISPQKGLIVRAPLRTSVSEIERVVASHHAWIEKKLKNIHLDAPSLFRNEDAHEITQYKKRARIEFMNRIRFWMRAIQNPIVKNKFQQLRISSANTRWGSCSGRGTISLNWRLIVAPPGVLDYVIVHELLHFVEPNHSANFWRGVERVIPDYKRDRQWLKDNGNRLY